LPAVVLILYAKVHTDYEQYKCMLLIEHMKLHTVDGKYMPARRMSSDKQVQGYRQSRIVCRVKVICTTMK